MHMHMHMYVMKVEIFIGKLSDIQIYLYDFTFINSSWSINMYMYMCKVYRLYLQLTANWSYFQTGHIFKNNQDLIRTIVHEGKHTNQLFDQYSS